MFAIGEFSRLSQVTIKTLRYYDEAGLLKPARVDSSSGYRYYSASQLPRLHRILVLKELGFTLDQIRELLSSSISAPELQGMLRLRQAEQSERLREEQARLRQIELMIEQISKEGTPMDIVIKQTEPTWVVSIRTILPSYDAIGALYPELFPLLGPKGYEAMSIVLWHDGEHRLTDIDGEACLACNGPIDIPSGSRATCYQLPVVTVASYIHKGPFATFRNSFGRMMQWLESSGYQPAGPARELYLQLPLPVDPNNPNNITELQIPVTRT